MAAGVVGILTLLNALLFSKFERRGWVVRAAWWVLVLVVAQAVLGGVTVLLKLQVKAVSIVHACLAQTFFCLTVALAAWTSRVWRGPVRPRKEPESLVPLAHIAGVLTGTLFLQIVFGALVRHTGWGFSFHLADALGVLLLLGWVFRRLVTFHNEQRGLWSWAQGVTALYFVQAALGVVSYVAVAPGIPWTVSGAWLPVVVRSAHVALGAVLLGASTGLALWAWRTRPGGDIPPAGSNGHGKIADYLALTKPRISLMTGLTALAGYVLGSGRDLDWRLLSHTGLGTFLVSAGACALNMLVEKDVDARMRRTARRPLPARRLLPGEALFLGTVLSVAGILTLAVSVNVLTAGLAGFTLAVYVYLYTPLKKISALCTAVGAVSGALPPVMGWTAATGHFGMGGAALFGILFFWQFPHFLALAWMYREDYARAGLSMLPVMEPDGRRTFRDIMIHSAALLAASFLPFLLGLAGWVYVGSAAALGGGLALLGWRLRGDPTPARARGLFWGSVAYLPVLMMFLVADRQPL
jgi:protoheme IX farnesyltransferase